ncbi:MAG: phage holin family protein [Candidatus Paceibacterota bacterium]
MYILTRWLLIALSLVVAAWLIEGVSIEGLYITFIAAALLGLINVIIRPVLILLTLPINIVTLGLFILVINTVLFMFVASFVDGFAVDGFGSAFLGALVVSVVSFLGNRLLVAHRAKSSPAPRDEYSR